MTDNVAVKFEQAAKIHPALTETIKMSIESSLQPEKQRGLSSLCYLPTTLCESENRIEVMANIFLKNKAPDPSSLYDVFEAVIKVDIINNIQKLAQILIRGKQDYLPSMIAEIV